MIEPFSEKLKRFFRKFIFWHKYGCCDKSFKGCKKCLMLKEKIKSSEEFEDEK